MLCMDSTGNARSCPFTHSLFVLYMQANVSPAVCVPTMQHSRAPHATIMGKPRGIPALLPDPRVPTHKVCLSMPRPRPSLDPPSPTAPPDLIPSRSVPPIMTTMNS